MAARTTASVALLSLAFLVAAAAPLGAQEIALVPVATNLTNPVYVTHAGDGSGRLFIVEQPGKIKIWDGTQVLPQPFLDIENLTTCCGERGLLSMAFHPNYASNGFFFVDYTDNSGDTVVARYRVSALNEDVANPDSGTTIIGVDQDFPNHNGGQLQFGPDGYLYISLGDGGSGGDPNNRGQDINELLGKMLRLDIDGALPYEIPPDNPFVGIPGRDEIWAYGLRNPWRFSFDRLTGDMFIGDVGQNLWEEVSFQPADSTGCENYGWRLMEGFHCFNPGANCEAAAIPNGCNPNAELVLPILEYFHNSNNCSITGGFRYRGTAMPELDAMYFYGDFCSGRIWGAREVRKEYLGPPLEEGNPPPPAPPPHISWKTTELLDTFFNVAGFGEDEQGEIYVAMHDGDIYRISAPVALSPPSGVYTEGEQFDLTVHLHLTGVEVDSIELSVNGRPLEGAAGQCQPGVETEYGGQTFSCPDVKGSLQPGVQRIRSELTLTDGRSYVSEAVWRIEKSTTIGRQVGR